ncbi:PTS sugar transporter subunit IIB [Sporolactobacillus shoreicorticis]|uniref:PTS system mannose/fructose/N-acetylgalactosamine-transporter subunit IIB n=1 Tax=Sporolactobacillus shoreicorticis TaxID=1923877 RepID=A0ABW5S0W1_9BACL|nr:PTS sugar transporter subunit IIB [Sporolactobacillus shoreicorticis]MCO7124705.1 PTS sugar transporter subunit IIB [Sporolactobacillus shoreicorticis]
MISMLRIDDRLIHGQVALLWSKQLQIQRIIVANDTVASNPIQKNALKLAAPAGIKVAIVRVEQAIRLVNDPRSETMKILLLVNNSKDLLEIVNNINEKPKIDIANVGRITGDIKSKVKLTETVYFTNEEIDQIKQALAKNKNMVYQPLPDDSPVEFASLLKEK